MQVYADLRVLSARPEPADVEKAPHALYGHVDGADPYSVGRYASDAAGALHGASVRGRLAIFVGGTGLYFKALTEGLSPIPEVDPGVRAYWRGQAGCVSASELHSALAKRDPVMAQRLPTTDPQRLVRALEVIESTGRSLAEWQAEPGIPVLAPGQWAGFVVQWPRDILYARAEARFDEMLDGGAVEEVRTLLARADIGPEAMVRHALGVSGIGRALAGEGTWDEARASGKQETRNYIKRQETWLKKNMMKWNNVQISENSDMMSGRETFVKSAIDAVQQSR